jgi:putative membrane protein
MFIPFLIGWAAGFLLLARAVELLFEASSSMALALFAGMVFGSVPEMLKKSEASGPKQSWSPLIIALAAAFAFLNAIKTGSASQIAPNAAWYIFCGAAWGLSLVIPGLSSSSILIYMGLYQPMTAGIADLDLSVILPLLAGLAVTVLTTARLINHLFENKYALMSRITIGVICASTLMILPYSFPDALSAVLAAACASAGFTAVRCMDTFNSR